MSGDYIIRCSDGSRAGKRTYDSAGEAEMVRWVLDNGVGRVHESCGPHAVGGTEPGASVVFTAEQQAEVLKALADLPLDYDRADVDQLVGRARAVIGRSWEEVE